VVQGLGVRVYPRGGDDAAHHGGKHNTPYTPHKPGGFEVNRYMD